eukprot:gb/GECG01003516.1/.p1 GENE.gb/GECG01003516.1/~~gb/GECG01003516.1/.p1  ORF type:complete len:286 (+),score=42.14 gb/GECG01003516.1/:1-858(+)
MSSKEETSTKIPEDHTFDANAARMERVFISISGLIGAGKTTLAKALAERLHLPHYEEPVHDNAYLQDFYQDMKKYSFPMQVYLLNKRFSQQQQIIWSNRGGVQDRTIYEDSVFAKMLRDAGLMEERDYETYLDLFNHMANFMRKPNIIVHLDVSPEESLRRIRMRKRECEDGITLEYLQNLYAAYNDFIMDIARVIPVIKVDYDSFRTVEEMAAKIAEEYGRIANIRCVNWGDSSPQKENSENEYGESSKTTPASVPANSPKGNKKSVESFHPRSMMHELNGSNY